MSSVDELKASGVLGREGREMVGHCEVVFDGLTLSNCLLGCYPGHYELLAGRKE
jgi:hypothetical protein